MPLVIQSMGLVHLDLNFPDLVCPVYLVLADFGLVFKMEFPLKTPINTNIFISCKKQHLYQYYFHH